MEKATAAEEVPPGEVPIKKEVLNDDIKEFAETAMNELLGWYGYSNNHREERNIRACRSHSGSGNSSGPASPKFQGNESCGWCNKPVDENSGLSSALATFCSELCFSQSRRANFKKNKTCDWCRHVRHTVSYVESQDGASQLQFCSDKCLNQYKMHIFWRETRAHLEIHPHLHGEESSSGTLITPDLWMAKCKPPEPGSTSPSSSPKPSPTENNHQQTSPLPLITLTHPSKLMSASHSESSPDPKRLKISKIQQKRNNKKKISTSPISSSATSNSNKPVFSPIEMPQDLRVRPPETIVENLKMNNESISKPPSSMPSSFLPNMPTMPEPSSATQTQYFSNNLDTSSQRRLFHNLLPPPTVLVPYPIILPLPIPIPIPIPLPIPNSMFKKDKEDKLKDASCQTDDEPKPSELKSSHTENSDSNLVVVEENASERCNSRPLRKRKTKIVIKNKRAVST